MAAVVDTANRLQIDPQILAATLHYESNFDPRAKGPSGKGYPVRGLIGFDPENVRRYGEPGTTIAAQMPQIEQYLLDRGWKPGQFAPNDLGRLYSIVNAGGLDKNDEPYWNRRDVNGSIAQHVERIRRGSMEPAQQFLSQLDPMAAINSALAAPEKRTPAPAGDVGKLFRDAGFDVPGPQKAAPAPSGEAGKPSAAKPKSIFEEAGFTLPTAKPAAPRQPAPMEGAPPGTVGRVPMPGGGGFYYTDAQGKVIQQPPPAPAPMPDQSFWQRTGDLWDRINEQMRASTRAPEIRQSMAEAFRRSADYAREQAGGVLSGQIDTIPVNRLGAAIGTGVGAAGAVLSPLTAATETLIEKPVTALTGSSEIGQRAGVVSGFLSPFPAARMATRLATEAPTATHRAADELVRAIGPENIPEAAARLKANPQLSLADISDPVRIRAQGLAADPAQPEAQRVVQEAVRQRQAEAPAQINTAYTAAMGPAPDTVKALEWLKSRARDVGRTEIEPALAKAKPVDTSPVVSAIDAAVKPGLTAMLDPATRLPLSPFQQELLRLKQQLVAPTGETLTDARRLHDVQSRLGDMAYQLTQSADGKDRWLGSQLRSVNEKLIDQIDTASGGAYRPARAKFKDAKDIHQAWEEGFDVLKNRSGVSGLEDRPEALREWLKTATPEEKTAKMLGVRSDIDQKLRGVRNQVLAGTNITKIEYNREKLEMLFGKPESDRLVRTMEDAADMARTNQKLVEGSKTAETIAGREAMAVRPLTGAPMGLGTIGGVALPIAAEIGGHLAGFGQTGVLGALTAAGLGGAKLGQLGWRKIGQLSDVARNVAFARAAMARGPERENILSNLMSHPQVVRELEKRYNAPALSGSSYFPTLF